MPESNVALVRRGIELLAESYAAGEAVPELLAMCQPELVVDASHRVFNPEVYDGRDGLRRLVRDVCEAWEGFAETTERIVDAGDRVVVLQAISGRGRASRVEVETKGAVIWTLRDGEVVHVEVFGDPGEALRAAGVEG